MYDFYPRPPRGGRLDGGHCIVCPFQFLSTPSARRATRCCQLRWKRVTFLSTPSARRATGSPERVPDHRDISIHALREEGDSNASCSCGVLSVFLSTPSARRATHCVMCGDSTNAISIHALREEGDAQACRDSGPRQCISIHALREEGDRTRRRMDWLCFEFLSTPSARRATTSGKFVKEV